jgi:hypothetical protein
MASGQFRRQISASAHEEFRFPSRSTTVPDGPDWLHEVKYDGYRLRVERDGDRVRLITRGGYDWTKRYPWITEAARKIRQRRFVLDGQAVILGVDGASDFNALHSRKHDDEVQFCAFDIVWPRPATTCASWRFTCARPASTGSGTPARGHCSALRHRRSLPARPAASAAPTCGRAGGAINYRNDGSELAWPGTKPGVSELAHLLPEKCPLKTRPKRETTSC